MFELYCTVLFLCLNEKTSLVVDFNHKNISKISKMLILIN